MRKNSIPSSLRCGKNSFGSDNADFMFYFSPRFGAFQFSFTVLVRYLASGSVFSLGSIPRPLFSQNSQSGLLSDKAQCEPTFRPEDLIRLLRSMAGEFRPISVQDFLSAWFGPGSASDYSSQSFRAFLRPFQIGIRSRALPFSLAATQGISVDFFSSA